MWSQTRGWDGGFIASLSPLQAQAHLGLGRCHRHAGRRAEARAEIIAAVDLFRTMESHWLPEAEAELRA